MLGCGLRWGGWRGSWSSSVSSGNNSRKDGSQVLDLRRPYENICQCERLLFSLAAIVGRVVAAEVGFVEGVAVWAVGTHSRIVAWRVMEVAVVLWVMTEAIVSIARAVL